MQFLSLNERLLYPYHLVPTLASPKNKIFLRNTEVLYYKSCDYYIKKITCEMHVTCVPFQTLKLVEETRDLNQKNPIDSNDVLKWISDQHILIRALESNLHQAQYTAKLSRIAEFIGDNITQV